MQIKAVGSNLVVRLDAAPTKSGAIHLPENVNREPQFLISGIVVDVGPGRKEQYMHTSGLVAMVDVVCALKKGDRVLFNAYSLNGKKVLDHDGRELVIVGEHEIVGRIEE